jgi:hypothetical protein
MWREHHRAAVGQAEGQLITRPRGGRHFTQQRRELRPVRTPDTGSQRHRSRIQNQTTAVERVAALSGVAVGADAVPAISIELERVPLGTGDLDRVGAAQRLPGPHLSRGCRDADVILWIRGIRAAGGE